MGLPRRWLVVGLFAVAAGCAPAPVVPADMAVTQDMKMSCSINPDQPDCHACTSDKTCIMQNPALPRCNMNNHTCTECLPGETDNCPAGQACTPYSDGYKCFPGCMSNADCQKIGGGAVCCGGTCHDPKTDVANCGACGMACPDAANAMVACVAGACVVGTCNMGFTDCDKLFANGCETNTDSNAKSCGTCGTVCASVINGAGTCKAGACSTACKAGFADCNKNLADGCETDLTFDVNNCGACGAIVPKAANATPYCDNSKPSFRCKGHFFDCDGDPNNGCELDTSSDVNNCGHCANVCPAYQNSVPSCASAQCGVSCANGFGDCDKNAMNGCESTLSADPKNCGSCGLVCGTQNTSKVSCSGGACALTCLAGFADCDGDPSNGCEVATTKDNQNCGGCGNVCPQNAKACSGSKCLVGCLNGNANVAPTKCATDKDPETNTPYTICQASCASAWLSSNSGGMLHALQICQSLGYLNLGKFGSSCSQLCGYCSYFGSYNCNYQGAQTYDGGGGCGNDNFGPILCGSVNWQCLP